MQCAPGMTCFLRDAGNLHLFKSIHPHLQVPDLFPQGQTSDKTVASLVLTAADICAESKLLILLVTLRGRSNGL